MEEKIIIDQFIQNPSEGNMMALIERAIQDTLSNKNIAYLAKKLGESGEVVQLKGKGSFVADIPSTGGPSSLSTLICPLVLMELNCQIPKLGVKGRPAGGIDVLYQIPDYKIHFDSNQITNILESSGYCHFIVSKKYAPLDARLFDYRSRVGAKAIPSLVIASILSKKIAARLNYTGLDVRVAEYGNFGHSFELAERNANRFIAVAKDVGINAKCFLNDFSIEQQSYIGRGESLLALLMIFENNMNYLLKRHLNNCIGMALNVPPREAIKDKQITTENLYRNFSKNLEDQGSSIEKFNKKAKDIQKQHYNIIKSSGNGFLKIDMKMLRDTIVKYQNEFHTDSLFPDPCGVILLRNSNDYIVKNESILTYRAEGEFKKEFENDLRGCFSINCTPKQTASYKILSYA